jgi:hypothetical protein
MNDAGTIEIPAAPPAAGPAANSAGRSKAQAAQPQHQPKVDESKLVAAYANFCRVTGTPEELIVDFGLNSQPLGANDEPVALTQRVVLNYFSAKRLLQALAASVARHEQVFGPLETNVLKRAKQ